MFWRSVAAARCRNSKMPFGGLKSENQRPFRSRTRMITRPGSWRGSSGFPVTVVRIKRKYFRAL